MERSDNWNLFWKKEITGDRHTRRDWTEIKRNWKFLNWQSVLIPGCFIPPFHHGPSDRQGAQKKAGLPSEAFCFPWCTMVPFSNSGQCIKVCALLFQYWCALEDIAPRHLFKSSETSSFALQVHENLVYLCLTPKSLPYSSDTDGLMCLLDFVCQLVLTMSTLYVWIRSTGRLFLHIAI